MEKSELRKADLITGLALLAGGGFALYAGWNMPRSGRLDPVLAFVTSPGMLPMACGFLLALMGAALGLHAARDGGLLAWSDLGHAVRRLGGTDVRRMLVVVLLLSAFIFVLIGRMPYWAATFIYLTALICYLRGASLLLTPIIAAVVAGGVYLIFAELVRIPLP